MKRRNRILGIVLAVVFVAGAIIYLSIPKEPRYQGRTLSAWLEDARQVMRTNPQSASQSAEWRAAAQAVQQIGTNAIPWLLKWSLAKADEQCWRAAFGFVLLGDKAKAARPILTQWSNDKDPARRVRGYYFLIMSGMSDGSAGDAYERLAKDGDKVVKSWFYENCIADTPPPGQYELFPNYAPVKSSPPNTNQPAPKK